MTEGVLLSIALADEVWGWLETVLVPAHPGWVRHSREGGRIEPGPDAGLGFSCLGLKLVHMLGLEDRLDAGGVAGWARRIRSFHRPRGRDRGYFVDPTIVGPADRRAGFLRRDHGVRRAESRQALATLLSVDAAVPGPLPPAPRTPRAARRAVDALPWSRPWHAGSQAAHLMAFLSLRRTGEAYAGLDAIERRLDALQDPRTGCWHTGEPSAAQKVNGAMKVIAGYEFAGRPFPRPEPLIDYALGLRNDRDACHHADLIYVLHACAGRTDHRRDEVRAVAEERMGELRAFRRGDGGFSFGRDGAGRSYYGVHVSDGLDESDIHGTTLFVWTLVMIASILGERDALGWRLPVT